MINLERLKKDERVIFIAMLVALVVGLTLLTLAVVSVADAKGGLQPAVSKAQGPNLHTNTTELQRTYSPQATLDGKVLQGSNKYQEIK